MVCRPKLLRHRGPKTPKTPGPTSNGVAIDQPTNTLSSFAMKLSEFIDSCFWVVLPYSLVRDMPQLQLSPLLSRRTRASPSPAVRPLLVSRQ